MVVDGVTGVDLIWGNDCLKREFKAFDVNEESYSTVNASRN
jgi:hypothetical protein